MSAERRRRRRGMRLLSDIAVSAVPKGKVFGNLTSTGNFRRIYREVAKRNVAEVEVICACGNTYWIRHENWGTSQKCRKCQAIDSNKKSVAFVVEKSELHGRSNTVEGRLFSSAKKRAEATGRDFSLKLSDIEIPDICPILGLQLDRSIRNSCARSPRKNAPSLDRIDSSKGYRADNIQVVSWLANVLKKDGTSLEHLLAGKYIEWVSNGTLPLYHGPSLSLPVSIFERYRGKDVWTHAELIALPRTAGEATLRGENMYFSGRLCSQSHLSPRRLDGKCRQCRVEKDNAKYQMQNRAQRKIDFTQLILEGDMPRTRKEAIQQNVKYYFPQRVCNEGHLTVWAVGGGCALCKREYSRKKGLEYYSPKSHKGHGMYHSLERMLWSGAKVRARKRQREFSIEISDVIVPPYCPMLGIKIDSSWGGTAQNNADRAATASLDRIDPDKGYVKGNVVVLSYRANMIKGDGSAEDHYKISAHLAKFGL